METTEFIVDTTFAEPTPATPFRYPRGAELWTEEQIDFGERSREDYGDLQELATSIAEMGIIHPPTLSIKTLVAGGRRMAAMKLLGTVLFPVNVREYMSKADIMKLEHEENYQRKQMTWKERVLLISRRHRLLQAFPDDPQHEWTAAMTGALFGLKRSHVYNILEIAKYLNAKDTEILEADGITEAWTILIQRAEDNALKESQRRHQVNSGMVGPTISIPITQGATAESLKAAIDRLTTSDADLPNKFLTPKVITLAQTDAPVFRLSEKFLLGDSVRDIMPKMAAESFDHIVTDPPYAIDMDNLEGFAEIDTVKDEHDVGENVEANLLFLEQAYRVLREGGFCIFFYDLDWHTKFQDYAVKVGFKVQRWPFLWIKEHNCRNQAPQYNFTKTFEYAMVLRKGNAVLRTPQTKGHINADGQMERKMYNNPFSKPFAVWKRLIEAVASPSQKVLDPFGGEFSFARAGINCGIDVTSIEKMEHHYNRGLDGIREMLKTMTGGQAQFT